MPATAVAADLITAFDADDEAGLDPIDRRGQRGQGMVEYAFIFSLVTIGLIVVVGVIGKQDRNMWSNVTNAITTAGG
jgi:Flp pilus assembly pilin Flp